MTTPRTDAAVNSGGNQLLNVVEESRQLETELIALQEENKTFRAAQKACETCDTVVYDQAIKERDQLLATIEGLRDSIVRAHFIIVANDNADGIEQAQRILDNALQSLPPTNLAKPNETIN